MKANQLCERFLGSVVMWLLWPFRLHDRIQNCFDTLVRCYQKCCYNTILIQFRNKKAGMFSWSGPETGGGGERVRASERAKTQSKTAINLATLKWHQSPYCLNAKQPGRNFNENQKRFPTTVRFLSLPLPLCHCLSAHPYLFLFSTVTPCLYTIFFIAAPFPLGLRHRRGISRRGCWELVLFLPLSLFPIRSMSMCISPSNAAADKDIVPSVRLHLVCELEKFNQNTRPNASKRK